ncbi:UDP-glycosyltransferase [Quillaja saponaria]|uniref:UDP-glycosyltransferase n=1 Tax=Quillaja saponaria TaxID=32244 RepID=A0AAD7LE84_QUISA|nr:UDP-glycosyltransferase [Quillaja saponaria]
MTISSNKTTKKPHVLVIPFPAQGHLIPILDLTHKLAAHGGLTITFFTTPKNLPFLDPLLSAHPSINTLVLPFPSDPSIPEGIENAKDLPNSMKVMIRALTRLHDPLLHWFKSHPSPPQSIISDMFTGWTCRLASELGIRRILFSPSGAFGLSTIYFLWSELPKPQNTDDKNEVVSFTKIPNSPKFPWWQVSPLYRSYLSGEPDSDHLKDAFRANLPSWGIIVNSFTELEKDYLDYLEKDLGNDRVWAVGPLFPGDDYLSGTTQRGGSSSVKAEEIMSWLDKREDNEVVYVCFGSQALLTKDQTEQLASGLEKSGVHFVWSLKDKNCDVIPSGFEDRVAERGLVIKEWAPQVLVLSHRAVGVFLTHCGWNSLLEAIVAGVAMLTWAMGADQFVNAKLLVDELKVAKRVCEGRESVPDSDELARVLFESVSENEGEKTRAVELRESALNAIKDGGSSNKVFRCLMDQLTSLEL